MNQEGKLSGPGTIEVAGFSRVFRTRSMAWPDVLFLPLADQVRQALTVADTLMQADPSKREDALLVAERYLSGCLLHDSNYLISAPGQTQEDLYQIDLKAGVLHFRSMMYTGQGQRTSCFKILISGDIRKGQFSLKSPADGPTLLTFGERTLSQPEFFSKILSPLCLVNVIQRDRLAHPENSSVQLQKIQLTLPVNYRGVQTSILIRNDSAAFPWQVFQSTSPQEIGTIEPQLLQDVDRLLENLTNQIQSTTPILESPSSPAPGVSSRGNSGAVVSAGSYSARS